jgi:putative sterol carrier protein
MTPQDVFDQLAANFDPTGAEGMDATIQFDLSGEGGGQWYVSIAGGRASVAKGKAPAANMTISTSAADYLEMIEGRLDPQMAFMGGRLSLGGDLSIAMRMQGLFKRPA